MRWRLESCACVFRYDDLKPDNTPIGLVVEKDCGAHGEALIPEDLFAKALAFNRIWAKTRLN